MKINRYHTISIMLSLMLFSVISCKDKSAKSPPPPQIQVMQVIQEDVPIHREFVGQVYGLLDIPIRARVEGYLEKIHFREGRRVKKGQLLYTIDSQPFQAEVAAQESRVAEAQTYLTNAKNELDRYEPLAKINAVSKSDLDAAVATKEAAEASLEAAKANLRIANINLGYCSIKSPIDGLIGKTEAKEGEFVGREPNPVILNMVSQIKKTRVRFFITESDYLALIKELGEERPGEDISDAEPRQEGNFELILSDGSFYKYTGNFDFIDRNVDVSTGSIMLQTIFPNPDGLLRPGMFAKVRVRFGIVENALLVPQRCIVELQGRYSVFVVNAEGLVQARPVIATEKVGDLWLIEEGLEPTDQIVLEGLQKVQSDMKINPVLTEFQSQTNQQ